MEEQLNLFGNDPFIELKNGKLLFFEEFFDPTESDYLFSELKNTIQWKQYKMMMFGREVDLPRLSAWYGDSDAYTYSGITFRPIPWTSALLQIKNKIEAVSKVKFNSVLANLYRDGNDSVSWHSDDEPQFGKNPVIGSVNFGATRRFMLRHKKDRSLKYEVLLKHGSFLLMFGELQHYWQHQVPKSSKKIGDRINLTFRIIK